MDKNVSKEVAHNLCMYQYISEHCWGCSFGEEIKSLNLYIYNVNEEIIPTQIFFFFQNLMKKLFSEENKVPRTLFVATKVQRQGPPNINKVRQKQSLKIFHL